MARAGLAERQERRTTGMKAPTPMQREQHAAEVDAALAGCFVCDKCGQPRLLFARFPKMSVCAGCWIRAGRPSLPVAPLDPEREAEIRGQMLERGGSERHMVRSGRT